MTKQISKKSQRLFALLLAVVMMVSVMPMNAIAVTSTNVNENGYIEVRTIEDLYNIRNDLTANYILMDDIDLTTATAQGGEWDFDGNGWNPIGSDDIYSKSSAFTGIFDGNGYTIKGMRITDSATLPSGVGSSLYFGLFGNNAGTIKNLHISGSINTSKRYYIYAGGIAAYNSGTITGCSNDVEITNLSSDYTANTGGIAAYNEGTIQECYNKAVITASYSGEYGRRYAGGISAYGYGGSTIENCYNTGNITAKSSTVYSDGRSYAGGIQGYSETSSTEKAIVKNCYNVGTIVAIGATQKNSAITYIESSNYANVQNCYYLNGTGNSCTGATALTDVQMKVQSIYKNFNFEKTWMLNPNAEHPYPQLQSNIQDVRVFQNAVIASEPNKKEYKYGEQLDLTGATLRIEYDNGLAEIIDITADMVSGFSATTPGTQIIEVKYKNISNTFTVKVNEQVFIPIYTVEDLYNIRNDLTANYILMNDIDLTDATAAGGAWDFNGNGWNPIGSNDIYAGDVFTGEFDGNGYSVIGMRIWVHQNGKSQKNYAGLFAKVSGSIYDLEMKNVNINIYDFYSDTTWYAGAIAGSNYGDIKRCSASGTVEEETYSSNYFGGLIGSNSANIVECFNTAEVIEAKRTGGIAGSNTGSIINCYNSGTIYSASTGSYSNESAGGITGYNTGTVENCYNAGTIEGKNDKYAIAYNYTGSILNSYYLVYSGTGATNCVSLNDAQMKTEISFRNFDFNEIWKVNANAVYPYPQLINNIQDDREVVEAIIYSLPKTTYEKWEEFDVAGCTLRYTYTNAPTEFINVTKDMLSGYDTSIVGTQTITIEHGNEIFTFDIEVLEKPFIEIYTIADLYNIRNDLTANYILMNDIDLTVATAEGGDYDFNGNGWNPIGSNDVYKDQAFMGVFDGNGYTIRGMRIKIKSLSSDSFSENLELHIGLFANVTGTVKNLHIVDSIISESANYYTVYAGGIAAKNSGTIINCSSDTEITASGYYSSGGYGASSVTRRTYVGGITGYNTGKIFKCYNTGNITAGVKGYAGGISGYGSSALVENCYNTAMISGDAGASGIQNGSTIRTSYNLGQCKSGYGISSSGVESCYYLIGTGSSSTGATPLSEEQFKDQAFLVGFDFDEVWISDPYAEYPYPQLRSNPQNLEQKVEEMSWITELQKKEYYIGEKLDLSGAKVEVVYVSGLFEVIDVTENMITGFDSDTIGIKTVTVSKGGNSVTFEVEVKEYPTVTNLVLVSGPDKTEFVKDRPIDYTGAVVRVTYEDGATADIDVTSAIVTGIDNSSYGTQTATVTVGGKTVTFDIKIIAYRLVGISVEKLPYKTTYIKDDVFNSAGLKVVADYNDGSTKVLQPYQYELTGYSNRVGAQTITVTYYGFSDTFEITVIEKQLANIEITKLPDRVEYIEGQDLDMTGAVITAIYNNGTTEVITDYNISGFTGEIGINNVIVASGGVSTTFIVTVREKIVTNIAITSLPTKYGYNAGETLDTTGLVVKAFYNDDSEQEITDYSLVGFSTTPGTHVITVSYAGFTDSFEIFMNEKVLSDFQITTMPSKLMYYLGENLDLSDMVATAYYNNGESYAVADYEVSGFDSQTTGTKIITIVYGGISRDFAVMVKERVSIVTGGEIKVGDGIARLGETITVPVSITKNTGLAGFTHTITFDHTRLEYKNVTLGEYFANGTVIVNTDNVDEGEITVLWFDVEDVAASNVAYNIEFVVLETATDGNAEINIAFNENDNGNLEGNNVIFNAAGGNVEVRSYWLGDLNGDREYHMVDLLQLAQYVSGKGMTLTEKQLLSADVNEDTIIDIHDVIMLQQWIIAAGVPEA